MTHSKHVLTDTDPLESARQTLAAVVNEYVDFAADCEDIAQPDHNRLWSIAQRMAQAGADFLWLLSKQEAHEAAVVAANQLNTLMMALDDVERERLLPLFSESDRSNVFDCLNDSNDAVSDWHGAREAHARTASMLHLSQ